MSIYLLKLTSLFTILYLSINTTVERSKYPIKTEKTHLPTYNKKKQCFKVEGNRNHNIRKKTLLDLKYHMVKKSSSKENVIQIILNQEGKIIGYKPCGIFYPNYFTITQPKSIIETSKKLGKNKTNLCLIKLKVQKAKINI